MKIASWNVNGIRARTEHVVNWLEATQPDVLAIQESKVVDDLFPYDEYSKLGILPPCLRPESLQWRCLAFKKRADKSNDWNIRL